MELNKRIQLLGYSTLLVGGFVIANMYIHHKNSRDIKEIAGELALEWKDKLGLSEEQSKKLQANILEFTILKNEIINSNRSQKFVIRDLRETQKREHAKLKRFLTSEQFSAYVGINKRIPDEMIEV